MNDIEKTERISEISRRIMLCTCELISMQTANVEVQLKGKKKLTFSSQDFADLPEKYKISDNWTKANMQWGLED